MSPPSDSHPEDPATPPPHGAASHLHVSPAAELPRDASIIPYDDDLEQLNSKYQLAWSKVVEEGLTVARALIGRSTHCYCHGTGMTMI